MKFFTDFSLRNPVAIVLLIILVAVGGIYSTTNFKQSSIKIRIITMIRDKLMWMVKRGVVPLDYVTKHPIKISF